MNLNHISNVYFIGIGGIGMSAIAMYFHNLGKRVMGYDRTSTMLTKELEDKGIEIYYEDSLSVLESLSLDSKSTLVVITPAIPKNHLQWNALVEKGFTIKKRAEVLGLITKNTYCFAVAGTHGKTTTSSILGHILYQSQIDVTAFLGGIVENYHSNLIGNGTQVSVVEADEFDRSFLHLSPNMACVTSMDADHLDIYGDSDSIEASFREFASKVDDSRMLFTPINVNLPSVKVGVDEQADFNAINIRTEDAAYVFDVVTPCSTVKDVRFHLPGKHNLSNALIAFSMAYTYGLEVNKITDALASFRGVMRRFSYQIKTDKMVYIDDYAHHPTEIFSVSNAVKELYPNRKVLAVFQPHLFSRTRDFIDGFAESLSSFENVMLLDIYPARELPIPGVTSTWLLEKITSNNKQLVSKDEMFEQLKKLDFDLLVTIGAGDIGELVPAIKTLLNEKMD